MTFAPWIFYGLGDPTSKSLLAHELVHIEQFNRYGHVGLLVRYAYQKLRYGYNNMPLENEAREAE